jgi:hypothetical protein
MSKRKRELAAMHEKSMADFTARKAANRAAPPRPGYSQTPHEYTPNKAWANLPTPGGMPCVACGHKPDYVQHPITANEIPDLPTAHATSHLVSTDQFVGAARRGNQELAKMRQTSQSTAGMEQHWGDIVHAAHEATRQPWGGETFSPSTGAPVTGTDASTHILAARRGKPEVTIPSGRAEIHTAHAMGKLRSMHPEHFSASGSAIGAFHDPTRSTPGGTGTISLDPTMVVQGEGRAKDIMSAMHSTGGAYHPESGNGVWPNHVADVKASTR